MTATSVNRNLNRICSRRLVVTCLSQVPQEHKEKVRLMVEQAREGYVNGLKVKGKADLRIKIVIHPEKGPEILHGSEAALHYQGATGFIPPQRFSL